MKNKQRFFIELLMTTINSSGFVFRSIPKTAFTSFLKLNEEYEREQEKLKQKYNRSSKTYFEENISVSGREDKLKNKMRSFRRRVESISPISSFEFYPNDALKYEYKELYDFYCSKTGHKRDKPFPVNKYEKIDLISTEEKINQIAKDYLEIDLLLEIQDELEFSEIYTSSDLNKVEIAADACWELYKSNNDIGKTELINQVLNKYHIQKYNQLSKEETEDKTRSAVKQWIRDVKKYKGIVISD